MAVPTTSSDPISSLISAPLGPLVEICIVTPNIRQTISALTLLGLGPFQIHNFNTSTTYNTVYKGSPSPLSLLVAFYTHTNGLVIELMQPSPDSPSLMADYLATHNNGAGLQHVAFDMRGPDGGKMGMRERMDVMAKRGVEVGMRGVWKGKTGTCEFCFFDTEAMGMGLCVETIEFSEDWVEPEGEWYPSRPGDVEERRSAT